ncbi:MAG: hypothetical protein R6U95_00995 [Bacteroidales bacterium]
MKQTNILFIIVQLFACIGASAQSNVTFTSSYTNQKDNCLWRSEITGIEPHDDDYRTCEGIGDYEIFEFYQTDGIPRQIVQNTHTDFETYLMPIDVYNSWHYGTLLEWRLANGEPFAVIYRITCYKKSQDGTEKKDEYLIVRGLEGYNIKTDINVKKTKNANKLARNTADKAFSIQN